MNLRNYQAAQKLSAEEIARERGAFFGSIIGTLNHLIVADTIWLQRIAHHPAQFSSLREVHRWPQPSALNEQLVTDLESWYARRKTMDAVISQLIAELTEVDLERVLHYTRTDGTPGSKVFKYVLQHFFNHQTHHRGQISTLLFQAGVDVGVTDLMSLVPDAVD